MAHKVRLISSAVQLFRFIIQVSSSRGVQTQCAFSLLVQVQLDNLREFWCSKIIVADRAVQILWGQSIFGRCNRHYVYFFYPNHSPQIDGTGNRIRRHRSKCSSTWWRHLSDRMQLGKWSIHEIWVWMRRGRRRTHGALTGKELVICLDLARYSNYFA